VTAAFLIMCVGAWECGVPEEGDRTDLTTNDIRTAKRYFDEAYGEPALWAEPQQTYIVTCNGLSFGWTNTNQYDSVWEESNARNLARDDSLKDESDSCVFLTSTGSLQTYLFGSADKVLCSDNSFGGKYNKGNCVTRGCVEK